VANLTFNKKEINEHVLNNTKILLWVLYLLREHMGKVDEIAILPVCFNLKIQMIDLNVYLL